MNEPILCILGPTASGKSALSIEKALECNGEIINADSMQVYRHLDIGTAKVSLSDQKKVPHHLIDICNIGEPFDVNMWVELAQNAIKEIQLRGKRPIICGGTGYYVKSLLYGLDDAPGDKELRLELDNLYDSQASEGVLHDMMRQMDPRGYALYSSNRRKLIRALEVVKMTGKSILDFHSNTQLLRYNVESYWLNPEREVLRERIENRVCLMLESGWIQETKDAEKRGLFNSPTARQSIGYNLIFDYLQGRCTYSKMKDLIVIKTSQYARRQRAWFKHQHPESKALTTL